MKGEENERDERIKENVASSKIIFNSCNNVWYILLCTIIIENLQYLRLGDNNIHQIPSESLRPLHRLRHLDLRSNNITIILEDAFIGYGDSITFLNLQKNE